MHKKNYGLKVVGGWKIDHIWLINSENGIKGENEYDNMQPLSSISNDEKANMLQGKIKDVTFAIHKVKTLDNGEKIGRMAIKIKESRFWAYDKHNY